MSAARKLENLPKVYESQKDSQSFCNLNQIVEVCPHCANLLEIIDPPRCQKCGRPMEKTGTCSECLRHRHLFERSAAVLKYEGAVRDVVHRFKYGNKPSYAVPLGRLMLRLESAKEDSVLAEVDCIAPVPLHKNRMHSRGFNQSALLAKEIAKQCGITYDDVLRRVKDTIPQSALTASERQKNIADAFMCKKEIMYKHVLVIDDIFTTGGTLTYCAKALLEAGAQRVSCLTLCIALKHDSGKDF